eukprot:38107-Pyramimonas_sp.AAC.1
MLTTVQPARMFKMPLALALDCVIAPAHLAYTEWHALGHRLAYILKLVPSGPVRQTGRRPFAIRPERARSQASSRQTYINGRQCNTVNSESVHRPGT